MISNNPNGNRNQPLRLLFIFRLFVLLAVLSLGIYLLVIPEGKIGNQKLIAALFLAYAGIRGYRLWVDYRNGHFKSNGNDE